MNRIISFFTVVISSIILFSSCCGSCEESSTTNTTIDTTIVTSKVERVRLISSHSGYHDLYFKLENGFIGVVMYYNLDDNFELAIIEVGDEISYRMSENRGHFYDSKENSYEVVKISFKKQDKDNSDSYWN